MKTIKEIKNRFFEQVLYELDKMAYPIVIDKTKHIEERKLKQMIFTGIEFISGSAFNPEIKRSHLNQVDNFLEFLKENGIERKDNIFYGIGKLSESEMEKRFGKPMNPNPNGGTFFKGRNNRKKD